MMKLEKKKAKYILIISAAIVIIILAIISSRELVTSKNEEWNLTIVNTSNENIYVAGFIEVHQLEQTFADIRESLELNESKTLILKFEKTFDISRVILFAGNDTNYDDATIYNSNISNTFNFTIGELYDLVAVLDTSQKNIIFSTLRESRDIHEIVWH